MFLTPRRKFLEQPDLSKYSLEDQVDFFFERIDGWHLEVADRCINGWKRDDGSEYINAIHLDNSPANYIPDSGWAVLQMVMNYFQLIAEYKNLEGKHRTGNPKTRKSGDLFRLGVKDVFPQILKMPTDFTDHLYALRNGLYHDGVIKKSIVLSHNISVILEYHKIDQILVIDPHKFVPHLRRHLKQYCDDLKNISNSQLRSDFQYCFLEKYDK